MQDDLARLTGINKFDDEERARSLERMKREQNVVNDELKRYQDRLKELKNQKLSEEAKVKGFMNDYDRQFLIREQNYKNVNPVQLEFMVQFFKAAAEHQKKLENIHTQYVAPHERRKQQEYEFMVAKNIEEERLKKDIRELENMRDKQIV